jgi:hypothetical protein
VQDVAGNALDGHFFGFFPSGNGAPGGDFVARLNSIRNIIFAPAPAASTATPLVPPGTPGRSLRIPTGRAVRENRVRLTRPWEGWVQRQAIATARLHTAWDAAIAGTKIRVLRAGWLGR